MSKIKKIAIIGLGKHSLQQIKLIQTFRPDIEINLLMDSNISSYYRVLSTFNNKIESEFSFNYSDILSNNIDLVYICTLANSHVEIAEKLIDLGYEDKIIIEKPVSNSLRKAKRLENKIKDLNWKGKIFLGFYRRYNLLYREIYKLIKEEELKSLKEINYYKPVEISMNGSHWIDFANWVNNSKIKTVKSKLFWDLAPGRRGSKILDPYCDLKIVYENDVLFSINKFKNKSNLIEMIFENGKVDIDYTEEYAEVTFFEKNLISKLRESKEKSFINFLEFIEKNNKEIPSLKSGIDVLEAVTAAHIADKTNNIFFYPIKNTHSIELDVG